MDVQQSFLCVARIEHGVEEHGSANPSSYTTQVRHVAEHRASIPTEHRRTDAVGVIWHLPEETRQTR